MLIVQGNTPLFSSMEHCDAGPHPYVFKSLVLPQLLQDNVPTHRAYQQQTCYHFSKQEMLRGGFELWKIFYVIRNKSQPDTPGLVLLSSKCLQVGSAFFILYEQKNIIVIYCYSACSEMFLKQKKNLINQQIQKMNILVLFSVIFNKKQFIVNALIEVTQYCQ